MSKIVCKLASQVINVVRYLLSSERYRVPSISAEVPTQTIHIGNFSRSDLFKSGGRSELDA